MGIILKDIHKDYRTGPKEVRAIDGVNLEIKNGLSAAIIGPSGAGKSTLLHVMGGLDRPSKGRVFINDTDLYHKTDSERARMRNRTVGFVFQFYYLLPEFTALENVMMPGLIGVKVSKCQSVKEVKNRARELLKLVGLATRMHHRPGELSGGESQRVAIARALINEPEFLLCDEPTGNLDSNTAGTIYELLFDIKSRMGTTLAVVTHDEGAASRFDRRIHIRDGRIV